jgi:drug/metabolite transporter (DMT)-like permease
MLPGLLAAVLASLGYGTSSVLQAHAARRSAVHADATGMTGQRTPTGAPTLAATLRAALTLWFLIGVALDLIGFVGGAFAARMIPLFLAQTILSANLVVTAVLGLFVLKNPLRHRDWVAIAGVVAALAALGLASGHQGSSVAPAALHWGVLLACLVVLTGGQLVVRRLGSRGAVAAGLIAGLLFGGLAIAARIVDGVSPWHPTVIAADPAAWTLLLAGLGGFYLHTVALQLGSVNGATAALVVGETVLPGIVGVLLLGDTTRPGLGWLAIASFVGAVAGAVAVAVFGTTHNQPTSAEPIGVSRPA